METPLASLSNAELVNGIRRKDRPVQAEFYRRYSAGGIRYLLLTNGVPEKDLEDLVHDTISTVIDQIQGADNELRNPACLPLYVRTIARRMAIQHRNRERPSQGADPERSAIINEQAALMTEALKTMRPADIEILTRFYLKGQKIEQITREMGLTYTQVRLSKYRAKSRLAETVQKKMAGHSRQQLLDRLAA